MLIITRGYKGLMNSAYSQYLRTGGTAKFTDLLQLYTTDPYRHYVDYDGAFELYGKYFGKENLIIMPYELLRDDTHQFITTLENQLGISNELFEIGVINPSLTDQEKYWFQNMSSLIDETASIFGRRVHIKVRRYYVSKLFHNRLNRLFKILIAIMPDKKQTTEISDEAVKWIAKGDSLRSIPIYDRYRKDYYIE